jgi:hypothetical protein
MKRDNLDDERPSGSESPSCVVVLSSLFCPPTNATTIPSSGNAFVQSEFDKLSNSEQERVFRDLYGLDDSLVQMEEDDPSIVHKKLDELEVEINSIKTKDAYEEAERRCPAYVEKIKPLFLLADLYDARMAARRIVKHWQEKLELFGSDRAFLGSIKQSELDEADMESLACGGLQILPEKDRGGRTVFWARREFFRYQKKESLVSCVSVIQ